MEDKALVQAVAKGDDLALQTLFERHAPWIAARLRRALPRDAVEDVLQETFIGVWRNARTFKGDGEVSAWLWGIVRRQTAMWLRKHGRSEAELDVDTRGEEDLAIAVSKKVDLERALATLGTAGNEYRELVRLLWEEGYSVAEVASRLGIPEGTVKSRINRLRRRLQRALERGAEHDRPSR
uniref:RNA polymerase sigma factor n=1 Tax=Thermorudis sp. TaxID=1969470 RepID=A0A7C3A927_9BACT